MEINTVSSNTPETAMPQDSAQPVLKRKNTRKRNIIIFTVVSILNVALLALLWTELLTPAHPTQTSSSGSSGFGDTSGVGDSNSPLLGKAMPDFTLSTLDGKGSLHLTSLKGQPIILNFWASWCVGCNQEAPFLQKAQAQLKLQGVQLIGIDGQELASAGQAFLLKEKLNYLNVHDTLDGNTAISYGVTGFPETVFINRDGIVVGKWIGALTDQGLKLELAKMNV